MNQAELKKLEEYLEGSNVFLFTDLKPLQTSLIAGTGQS